MTTDKSMNRLLAVVLFTLLAGVQHILAWGHRSIHWLIHKSDGLGHFMATRLLAK